MQLPCIAFTSALVANQGEARVSQTGVLVFFQIWQNLLNFTFKGVCEYLQMSKFLFSKADLKNKMIRTNDHEDNSNDNLEQRLEDGRNY